MSLLMMFLGIYMSLFRKKNAHISSLYFQRNIYVCLLYDFQTQISIYREKNPICTWISISRNFFDILWHFCWLILNYPDTVINLGTIHHGGGWGGGGPGVTQREKTYFMNNDKHLFCIKQCRDNHLLKANMWVGVSGLKQLKEMIYMPTRADTC